MVGDRVKKFGTAVILAGGKSTRMGFDKQFLQINEERLINYLIKKLDEDFDEIIVVTNKSEEYKEFDDKIMEDIIVGKGPLSGIHAGLSSSSSKYVYFIACDMPNVNLDYIRYMKKELEALNVKACGTRSGKYFEPFNAFYSKDIIEDLERNLLEDKKSVNYLLKTTAIHSIEEEKAREFSPSWDMFFNLNTEEDLNEFLNRKIGEKDE